MGSNIKLNSKRYSNIELFRIITMLVIVAHHFVVNSGLFDILGTSGLNAKSMFAYVFGAWGKTGINCFVLITGYFMCKSNITIRKFVKLLAEILFYNIVIGSIFLLFRYPGYSLFLLLKSLFVVKNVTDGFTSAFLVFYLFIPFLNLLIKNINQKVHITLLVLCIFIYVILGSIPKIDVGMNYLSWFIVLYFVSSFIRMYDFSIFSNKQFWLISSIIMIVLSVLSIVVCLLFTYYFRYVFPYYFLSDSNKIFAFTLSACLFMLFKNMNIKYNKVINFIASSTFGVLLIHANSDTMRQFLWKDICNVVGSYNSNFFFVYSILCVVAIFIICTIIDKIRIYCFEKTFFKFWDNYVAEKLNAIKKKIIK